MDQERRSGRSGREPAASPGSFPAPRATVRVMVAPASRPTDRSLARLPPPFAIQPQSPGARMRAAAVDPLFSWQRGGRARTFAFGVVSLALHAAFIGAVVLGGHASSSFAADRDLIDVSMEPALGSPQGTLEGKGLGSHIESSHAPHAHPAAVRPAAAKPVPVDPAAPADPAAPPPAAASASAAPAASSEQPAAAPGDSATPVGSANVAPGLGRPDGSETGSGMDAPKPRMTPQYAGQLAGWFGARFNVRGLGLDPEELKKLSIAVSISISPDRHVTGFSLRGTSGNAAYDDEVRRTIAGIQGSGVALPEPVDGSTPPANFTVRFRPQVIR